MQTNYMRGLIGSVLALVCFQCVASTAQATALWPTATVDSGNFMNSNLVTPPFQNSATAAVHFYSSAGTPGDGEHGSPVTTTFEGIAFNNVNFNGAPNGSLALNANPMPGSPHLTYTLFPTGNQDTTGRDLGTTTVTGTDSTTIANAGGNGFYLAHTNTVGNYTANLLYTGLEPNSGVYVQILGGVNPGWSNTTLSVQATGATTATGTSTTWVPGDRSLLSFYAVTSANGSLDLQFNSPPSYLGIGAVLVSESVPEPSSLALAGVALVGSVAALRARRTRRAILA